MELKLETRISVGLATSDFISALSSESTSEFGTGSNLALEVCLRVDPLSFQVTKQKWQKILKDLHADLDHVHLNFDHPELKSKNWGESKLHDWLINKLSSHAELKALSLKTYENYSLKWQAS